MTGETMLDHALAYAAAGWPVFPCNPKAGPKEKRPLLAAQKDPETGKRIVGTGGLSLATTDPEQIREWWAKWPKALIGVAMGRNGLFALDFDPRVDPGTGEVFTLERLKADLESQMGCALPQSIAVRTPSDGIHVYFRQPDDGGAPVRNRGVLPEHVDVRGLGGYVIAPPSVMSDGRRYRWLRGDFENEPMGAAPVPLIEILRAPIARNGGKPAQRRSTTPERAVDAGEAQKRYAMAAMMRECEELAATPIGGGNYGGRNEGAFHAANVLGQLVGAGALSESVARAALLDAIKHFNSDHSQAIENGLTRGMDNPRDLSDVGQRAGSRGKPSTSSGPRPPHPTEGIESYASFQNGTSAPQLPDGGAGGAIVPHEGDEAPSIPDRIKPDPDPALDRRCAFFPQTDLGNAERFRARHGHRFRFCKELGWFVWDGRRWALLSEEKDKEPGEVTMAVMETVRSIQNEADLVAESGIKGEEPGGLDWVVKWVGPKDDKIPVMYSDTLLAHAKSSEGANRLKCIGGLAKAFPDIAIKADAMDADRMAINVLNGTLRMVNDGNRLVIRRDDHNPLDLISKIANVVYDPDATCEDYDSFLSVVQPSEDMRRFLHQWGGMSLTGDITEHKLAFFYGKGRNGKSTLVDAWAHIAGDYGGSVAIETFLEQGRARKGGEATPDLARLPGVRFLRASEPEKGAKLAEGLIKSATGGEPMDARHLNKGFFSFLPSFKLTVSGNYQPKITGTDDGIWARMQLVPWDVRIPDKDIDRRLPDKLKAEASGILNRLIEGMLDWRMNGLFQPDSVKEATRKYRERSDQLGRFLEQCTRDEKGKRSKSSLLYALFVAWSKSDGAAEWSTQGFSKAMEDRGYEKITSNGVHWVNIEMTATVDQFVDAPARRRESTPSEELAPAPPYDDDGGGLQDWNDLP